MAPHQWTHNDFYLDTTPSGHDNMSSSGIVNGTASNSSEANFVRWNVRDGIIFGLILLAWICALVMFLHKWGSFRLPQPRSLIRRFRPMNVDDVRVINKEHKSVIYKSYSQRMNITMGDRRKRLEERAAAAAVEEEDNNNNNNSSGQGSREKTDSSSPSQSGVTSRSLRFGPNRFSLFNRSSKRRRPDPQDSMSPISSSSEPSLRPTETEEIGSSEVIAGPSPVCAPIEPASSVWGANRPIHVTITSSLPSELPREVIDSIV